MSEPTPETSLPSRSRAEAGQPHGAPRTAPSGTTKGASTPPAGQGTPDSTHGHWIEKDATCGHPNHGGADHDCAPFRVETARLYLDVDGVLNAVTALAPEWGWDRREVVKVMRYPIQYSPDFIDVLNAVAKTPGLGVYWLTTWCHDAPERLAPALGIDGADWPVVGYEHWRRATGLPWWKHLAIVEHLDGFSGPVLWIDDDHGVDPGSVAWLAGQPQILAMAPSTSTGVTRAEADIIERFAADVVLRPGQVTP